MRRPTTCGDPSNKPNCSFPVYRQILPAYLLERLGENASQGQEAAASSTVRALPVADDLDAHLLMPSEVMKKMKHKQKQIVLEKAVDSVTDTLAGASNVPLCRF